MSDTAVSFKLSQSNLSSLHALLQEAESAVKAMEAVRHRKEYVQKQLSELDEVLKKHTEKAEAAAEAYHVAELKLLEEISRQSREAIKKEEEDRLRAEEERLKAEAEEAKKLEQEFVKDEPQSNAEPSAPPVEALPVDQVNKEDLPPAQAPASSAPDARINTPPCTPNTPRVKGDGVNLDDLVDDYVEVNVRPSPVIEIRKKK
jgi:hypothetical protein